MNNKYKLEKLIEGAINVLGVASLAIILFASSADLDPFIEWLVS